MDFSLSFEQQALVELLEEFVKKELYPHERGRGTARRS